MKCLLFGSDILNGVNMPIEKEEQILFWSMIVVVVALSTYTLFF
jgi:hypothetical protein